MMRASVPLRACLGALVLLLAASFAAAQEARPGRAAAAQPAWVESTLATLSLREKVAQMVMPQLRGNYAAADSPEMQRLGEWVEREGVGGFVVSVGMPLSYAAKLNELQRRARVPLLVASDMENGPGMRMAGIYSHPHRLPQGGGTEFPPAMALGATGDDSLAYALGRVLAAEARAVGVHVTFGPVLDVNSNPANPIINTRSFGEDPALVGRMGAAYVRAARDGGLMTTGKHFPGHGDTEADSHLELPAIRADRARMDSVELAPFATAVRAGIDGIMTAHIAVTGVEGEDAPPATLSPYFMTRVLRGEMGFEGLLYTDAMDMGGVRGRYGDAEAAIRAVEAGADVLLMPPDVTEAVDAVTRAVLSGRLSEERIDASVRRILRAKERAGLPARRLVQLDSVDRVVGARPHAELAARIAERSITLARDLQGRVPLAGQARRVLSVTYAEPGDPIAGVVFDSVLASGGREVESVRVDGRTTPAEFEALRGRASSADLVLVSAYVVPVEFAGSIGTRGGFSGFVRELVEAGTPLVATSFGSPYLLASFPDAPAYLLAWGGAPVSQAAAARALLGRAPVTGTLPISLPPHFVRGEGLRRDATAPPHE